MEEGTHHRSNVHLWHPQLRRQVQQDCYHERANKSSEDCHCFDPTKTLGLNPKAWADPAPGAFGTSTGYSNDYRQQRAAQDRAEFTNSFNRTRLPNPSSATPLTAPTCVQPGTTTDGAC